MLSGISQAQKNRDCMISFVCGIKSSRLQKRQTQDSGYQMPRGFKRKEEEIGDSWPTDAKLVSCGVFLVTVNIVPYV